MPQTVGKIKVILSKVFSLVPGLQRLQSRDFKHTSRYAEHSSYTSNSFVFHLESLNPKPCLLSPLDILKEDIRDNTMKSNKDSAISNWAFHDWCKTAGLPEVDHPFVHLPKAQPLLMVLYDGCDPGSRGLLALFSGRLGCVPSSH